MAIAKTTSCCWSKSVLLKGCFRKLSANFSALERAEFSFSERLRRARFFFFLRRISESLTLTSEPLPVWSLLSSWWSLSVSSSLSVGESLESLGLVYEDEEDEEDGSEGSPRRLRCFALARLSSALTFFIFDFSFRSLRRCRSFFWRLEALFFLWREFFF